MEENIKKILMDGFNELKIEIDEDKIDKFIKYMDYLIEYNKKVNLTSIIEPSEIVLKHFIDSLTINKYVNKGANIIDVGTGAGFPGIPLKIMREDIKITLLDSLNKRIVFLNEVIKINCLHNITTVHGRAEEYGNNNEGREKYDVATSRAVARLDILVEYLMPLVKIGGICICMKGPSSNEEIEEAKEHINELGGRIEKIENLEINMDNMEKMNRTIIIIKKERETSSKYPRNGLKKKK